ncbi:MBL fold metallo-hydrolase [Virgibacillus sediminis]
MTRITLVFTMVLSVLVIIGCTSESSLGEAEEQVEREEVSGEETKELNNDGVDEEADSASNPEETQDIPDGFRVTAIGAGSPTTYNTKSWPATLVQYQDKYFLVDCGGGCTNGIAKAGVRPSDIDNILFSHHHADHNSDFLTILIAGWATDSPRPKLNLVGTEGTKAVYDFAIDFYKEDIQYRIDAGFTTPQGIIDNVELKEVEGGEQFELDGVKISTIEVPHSIKTVAYKFEAGGKSVVITGDTEFSEDLIEFSKDTDLVVMDGMLTEVKEDDPSYSMFQKLKPNLSRAHMTLEEIGKTAAEGNYKQMVLTHLFNGEMDKELTTEVLRKQGYEGEVIIAESLKAYEVD